MSKHTPGPWVVRHDFKCADGALTVGVAAANIGAGSGAVAWPCGTTDAQELANARLIAAAPELLAAAQAAKLALDDLLHAKDGRDWWTQRDAAMMLIDAAIAKATGDAT